MTVQANPGSIKNNKESGEWLSRGILNTAKSIGKIVGYSADSLGSASAALISIGNQAARVAGASAKSVEALFVPAKGVPISKEDQMRVLISGLQAEIDQLEGKMGAKLAANVTAGAVNPAEDEEVQELLKAINTRKKEIDDLEKKQKLEEMEEQVEPVKRKKKNHDRVK